MALLWYAGVTFCWPGVGAVLINGVRVFVLGLLCSQ